MPWKFISTALFLAYSRFLWYIVAEVIALKKFAPPCKINRSVILYMIFGLLTTVVNYLFYFLLFYLADFSALLSNIIAWFFSVLFSFFVNKFFVFKSPELSFKRVVYELICFFGARLLTGALETAVLFILVDVFKMSGLIWKLAVSGLVVVCNYVTSLKVFRHN